MAQSQPDRFLSNNMLSDLWEAYMFEYQPVVRATAGPYYGAALVGTYSTVIGWSFDDENLREGLLGFAVKRTEWDNESGEIIEQTWLGGYKRFKDFDPGSLGGIGSLTAPFQRFRWNDYTLHHTRSYRFEVYPMRGVPGQLIRDEDPLIFEFSPTPEDDGKLGVYVNRGVTAAKAYYQRFGDRRPSEVSPPAAAYSWLSRGLKESLIKLIVEALPGDALHLALYEFEDLEIATLLKEASERGVDVKIVHDAKKGKSSTKKSRHMVHEVGVEDLVSERTTVNISHNKTAILLRNGQPKLVWAGSANMSENAFNYQTNSALLMRDQPTLDAYEAYFQNLLGNPAKKDCKVVNQGLMNTINSRTPRFAEKLFFSPIAKEEIIDTAVDLIENAKSIVLVSAPFFIHKDMIEALGNNTNNIIEYGLVNATSSGKIKAMRKGGTQFYPPNKLETFQEERWDAKAFGAHKIHSKFIVVDPFGENPKVLFGSANFSKASCKDNDENALLIVGNKRLAAILATEYLRMHDHYKIRYYTDRTADANKAIRKENRARNKEGLPPKPYVRIPYHLEIDKRWSKTAFDANSTSHKFADRLAFSGNEL